MLIFVFANFGTLCHNIKFVSMKSVIYSLLSLYLLLACKPENPLVTKGIYTDGAFVVNEGIYGQTSGTITYYHLDSSGAVQDIFRLANGRDLGNVVQSLYFYDDKAYIVVNNSNKIEVADADDFSEIAQINGLEQPRYFLPISSNRALVSQWGNDLLSGSLALIDLENNSIIQKITNGVGKGPERMIMLNNKVYIANVGGLEFDNFISVFNVQTMMVEDTIQTDDAPNSLQLSPDGIIWVACKGKTVFSNFPEIDTSLSTNGSLIGIDANTNIVNYRILLQKGKGASSLIKSTDTEMLFIYNNSICRFNTQNQNYTALISGSYYGLGAKPGTDYFYACSNAGIQASKVYRVRLSDAVKIDSFYAGIFANAVVFNP
jgi:hypothetical protein